MRIFDYIGLIIKILHSQFFWQTFGLLEIFNHYLQKLFLYLDEKKFPVNQVFKNYSTKRLIKFVF